MATRKGFTLLEIIVVLMIVGVLVAIAVPTFMFSVEQSKAQSAQNNLLAILTSQSKYHEDYNVYCTVTTGNTIPCGDIPDLANNLHLTISSNDPFQYSCIAVGSSYTCTATDNTDTLILNPNAQSPASPVSCFGTSNPVPNFSNCTVSCVSTKNGYCPSNLQ